MKRILRLGFIIFTFILLTGCGTKILVKSNDSNNKGTNTDNSMLDRSDIESSYVDNASIFNSNIESSYNFSSVSNLNLNIKNRLLFPIPASSGSVDWGCGTYYSDISKENLETYLQLLVEDGWKDLQGNNISTKVADGTSEYTLSKGDNLIQIMTFLMDPDVSICNSILIKLEENISIADIENRRDALTKSEAHEKIQDNIKYMVEREEIPSTKRNVTGVFEIFIDDAFYKMNLQAYAAISDNGFTGCFLIRKNVVSYVPGYLDNTCVADIDSDGKYELLDLYGWGSGIFRYELTAYDFVNPIYFSSLTEILHRKYYNCFVPNKGYAELLLKKVDNTTVKLGGDGTEYGILKTDGSTLVVENMEEFPFEEWSRTYDQSLLLDLDKAIPSVPPEIVISIDGLGVDYEVRKTHWNGESLEFTTKDAFTTIINKEKFVPTFSLSGMDSIEDANTRLVTINFGNCIPDSIQVYDAMLTEQGSIKYGDKHNMERTVKILDGSRVQFDLQQHMALYLSSNSQDYEKDWYRMFRIVCKWGANECTYVFVINTGKTEALTEIADHQFLTCEGTYSALSSSWGLGLSIDSKNLPEQYIIEWQVSEGLTRSWSETNLKPMVIMEQHNGYPMSSSKDDNKGAVIWSPKSFDSKEDVTITAYIYESAEDKSPIASSKIILDNIEGVYQTFSPTKQNQLADKLHLKEEEISIISKSISDHDITMSVVSSHVAENTAVVMLAFAKDSDEAFGNCLNPDIRKLILGNETIGNQAIGNQTIGNKTIENQALGNQALGNQALGNKAIGDITIGDKTIVNKSIENKIIENYMLVSQLSEDKKTLYCYVTWHTDGPLAGKTVTINVEQLICNESQVIGKTFSDQIIFGKWSLNFVLKANNSNIITGKNLDLSKTVLMCGKELQIDSVEIADLQVIVNTTTLSDSGKPENPLSNVSTDSGMYYGVSVTVVYADGSQSEKMDCMLDENNNIIAYSFNPLTDKKINEVHVKDVVVFIE